MSSEATSGKTSVLFLCVHNSARSQMAEAFLKQLGGERFDVESAGLEPGELNPLAVEAMSEVGIDISKNQTKSVMDLYKQGKLYTYVVTVCDQASAELCPIFPGNATYLYWPLEDPASFTGTHEERLIRTREIRDQTRSKVEEFAAEYRHGG
jgi:arsenate reductase (thioredoxin)